MKAASLFIALLAAAVLLGWLALSGLGGGVSAADPAALFESLSGTMDLSGTTASDAGLIRRLYGVDPADYEFVALICPSDNMGVTELFLAKTSDPAAAERARDGALSRLESQKTSFDGYGERQFSILTTHSVVKNERGFVLFAVTENDRELIRVFEAGIRGA